MKKEEFIEFANKQLIEIGNLDVIADVFDENYIVHAGNKKYQGHSFIKRWAKQLSEAMPDIHIVAIIFLVETEETIVWQRRLKGTHIKKMWGINATNQLLMWNEMVVSRIEGNKIAEEWVVSELAGEMLSKSPKLK